MKNTIKVGLFKEPGFVLTGLLVPDDTHQTEPAKLLAVFWETLFVYLCHREASFYTQT